MHELIHTCFKSTQLGLRMSLLFCGFVKESSLNCHQTARHCWKHENAFKNACNTIVFLSKFCIYSSRGVRNHLSPTKVCQRYFIKTHFSFFSGMGYTLGVLLLHFILENPLQKIILSWIVFSTTGDPFFQQGFHLFQFWIYFFDFLGGGRLVLLPCSQKHQNFLKKHFLRYCSSPFSTELIFQFFFVPWPGGWPGPGWGPIWHIFGPFWVLGSRFGRG